MSKSSHLDLHYTDSEALDHLDSISLPSEPPDIKNWFSSYIYESPELNASDGFRDSNGAGETCEEEEEEEEQEEEEEEENTGKSGNNYPSGQCTDACSAELPDIGNWFSSYVYESPLLDSASDFAILDYKEREYGKSIGDQNAKDRLTSINVETTDQQVKDTSDAVLVKDTKLDHQSLCREDDDDDGGGGGGGGDDVSVQPFSSIRSLLSSDNVIDTLMPGHIAGHNSLKNANSYGRDYDSTFSNRKPVYSSVEGSVENKETIDTRGTPADNRNIHGKENKEASVEDGFICVRKRSCTSTTKAEIGVKAMIKHGRGVRKVLSEIRHNFNSENVVGSTGKWCCPQKSKPDTGPPTKQLRLDRWVRRL